MRRESFFATMSLSFMKPMRKRGKEEGSDIRFLDLIRLDLNV